MSSFLQQVLVSGNADLGPGHWATAEGDPPYCDLVVDWWPDGWVHPVGYHVTLPCSEAAHRTFDAAWTAVKVR